MAAGSVATVLPAAERREADRREADRSAAAGKTAGEAGQTGLFFKLIPILALLSN